MQNVNIDIDPSATVGAMIADRRRALKWSQQRLADHIGYSRTHIDRVEGGSPTTVEALAKIATALRLAITIHPDGMVTGQPEESTMPQL